LVSNTGFLFYNTRPRNLSNGVISFGCAVTGYADSFEAQTGSSKHPKGVTYSDVMHLLDKGYIVYMDNF